jgi:hypothetical protein
MDFNETRVGSAEVSSGWIEMVRSYISPPKRLEVSIVHGVERLVD